MTSKHHKWQLRWTVDQAAGVATHDTGLVVHVIGSRARANNAAQVQATLTPKHGHNAAAMIGRLEREAARLLGLM